MTSEDVIIIVALESLTLSVPGCASSLSTKSLGLPPPYVEQSYQGVLPFPMLCRERERDAFFLLPISTLHMALSIPKNFIVSVKPNLVLLIFQDDLKVSVLPS